MTRITVEEALQRASFRLQQVALDQPRVEAEHILAHLMKLDRLQLILRREEELQSAVEELLHHAVKRRSSGEPLAYITGEKYFYGYKFMVNREVLIPRPETELIIDSALSWVETRSEGADDHKISGLDLGTGSGVLAITLALKLPGATFWALDLSAGALGIAQKNAALNCVDARITWQQGNYCEALDLVQPRPQFNLVVSNPPYISEKEFESLPRNVKSYEPALALDGGEDGLDSYRSILKGLPPYLQVSGLVLFEIGAAQQGAVETLCRQSGLFSEITWLYDLSGHPRVMKGYY
ncbi:MAG: peptide chain release factor N(5)-glutamine methyltransferase [Dethiobacteria bacterium]|nr:peptide chain release factor N(5)-glutamine methyltransferase [Dethiobacteria bacterium]